MELGRAPKPEAARWPATKHWDQVHVVLALLIHMQQAIPMIVLPIQHVVSK